MLKFICLLMLSSRSFIVLCFTFRLKIDFELIFLKCVKSVSRLFFFFCMQISSLIAQSVKSLTAGDLGSILGLGRSPGQGNGNPLQCSCLENPMERGAWQTTVYGVTRVRHN